MKAVLILAASLAPCAWCAAQDADVEQLMAQKSQAVQEQIARVYTALHQPGGIDTGSNVEAFRELQALKGTVADQGELVKQIAIFAATPTEDEQQPLVAVVILGWLQITPKITIRALAPYLDTKNPQLHSFLYDIFHGLDNADPSDRGAVNYCHYLEYVRWLFHHDQEVPAPFVKYIYERSPGRALLVFAYASGSRDVVARLQLMRKTFEARQQGKELEPQEVTAQQLEEREKVRSRARRQIELAEHIVSNAIWLDKHGYIVRFQKALPEAKEALATLAEGEWWARLYVAEIMRQHRELRQPDVLRQLSEDGNDLVSKAAKAAGQ